MGSAVHLCHLVSAMLVFAFIMAKWPHSMAYALRCVFTIDIKLQHRSLQYWGSYWKWRGVIGVCLEGFVEVMSVCPQELRDGVVGIILGELVVTISC